MSEEQDEITDITDKTNQDKGFEQASEQHRLELTLKSLLNFNEKLASLGNESSVRVSSLGKLQSQGAVKIKRDDSTEPAPNVIPFKP